MAVDVSIKIRMIDDRGQSVKEVTVSKKDNALGSILDGSDHIKHTNVSLKEEGFLSKSELGKIKLGFHPAEDSMMISKIIASREALDLFNQINNYSQPRLIKRLHSDIAAIASTDLEKDLKAEKIQSKISDYWQYGHSLHTAIGILKLAIKSYPKVQIVGEYY